MALSTYSEIKVAVADWLNRSDLLSHIPAFVALAEKRINRDVANLQLLGLERRATSTATGAYVGVPTGILSVKSVKLNTSPAQHLKYMPPDAINERFTDNGTNRPVAYTVIGDELKLAPAPDSSYEVEVIYCAKEAALSDTDTSNWFTANAPDLILYAALMEAEPFLKNDERLATWAQMYKSGLKSLEDSNNALRYPSSGLQTMPA